jgi:hypothetical protein
MLYRKMYGEIAAVCSEIYIKHKNTICGQKVEMFFIFKLGASKVCSDIGHTILLRCEIAGSNLKFFDYILCGC